MQRPVIISLKLTGALLLVSGIEIINLHFIYLGLIAGWFPALYFPILLGLTIWGITIYFCVNGVVWKRLLAAVFGGLLATFLWLLAFVLISGRIMHWTDVVWVQGS